MIPLLFFVLVMIFVVFLMMYKDIKSKNIIPKEPDTLSNEIIGQEWHNIEHPNCNGKVKMTSNPDFIMTRGVDAHKKMMLKLHERKWFCSKCGWSSRTFLLTEKQKEEDDIKRFSERRGLLGRLYNHKLNI